MLEKRKKCKRITAFLLAVMLVLQLSPTISKAEQRSYTLSQGDKQSAEIYVKDSGVINVNYIPSTTEATTTEVTTTEVTTTEPEITTEDITTEDSTSEEATSEASEDEAWFGSYHTGSTAGTMKTQSSRYWWYEDYNYGYSEPTATTSDDNVITSYTYKAVDGDGSYYDVTDSVSDKMTMNVDGSFTANKAGTVTVYVDGKNAAGILLFHARITFTIKYDMSKVSFSKTKLTGYMFPGSYGYYDSAEISVPINSIYTLDSDDDEMSLSVKASAKSVSVYDYSIKNNVLSMQLSCNKSKTTNVKVTICGTTYTLQVTLKQVSISESGAFVVKGKSKRLKVKNYSGKVTWKSSNPSVASVSSKGVVKAKKAGNALITAKFKGKKLGCVISVNTAQIQKVVTRARYIGTHWTYSQPKRTQNGYYDCSALVWKAYKYGAGYTFGSAGYPGTTVTESSYLIKKKRMIKGGYSEKKIQKLIIRPGDCVFKTTGKRTPANTYHVEMITGLRCAGFDGNTPIIVAQWAARGESYGAEEGSMLGRPTGSMK